eukprot:2816919-Amphidinium_carterae.1
MDSVRAIPCVVALTAPTSSDSHDDKLVSACFPLFQWMRLRNSGSLPIKMATPSWDFPPGASDASDVMKRIFFADAGRIRYTRHISQVAAKHCMMCLICTLASISTSSGVLPYCAALVTLVTAQAMSGL